MLLLLTLDSLEKSGMVAILSTCSSANRYTLPDCGGYGIGGARVYLDVATGLTADVEVSVSSPAHIDYLGKLRSAHLVNAAE